MNENEVMLAAAIFDEARRLAILEGSPKRVTTAHAKAAIANYKNVIHALIEARLLSERLREQIG